MIYMTFFIKKTEHTITIQYQTLTKFSPISIVLRTNNNKTITKHKSKKYKIQPIPIAIKLLGVLLKKGQYIVPNTIVDK